MPDKMNDSALYVYGTKDAPDANFPGYRAVQGTMKVDRTLQIMQNPDDGDLSVVYGTSSLFEEVVRNLQMHPHQWFALAHLIVPNYRGVYMGQPLLNQQVTAEDGSVALALQGTHYPDTATTMARVCLPVTKDEALSLASITKGTARSVNIPLVFDYRECGCVNLTNFTGDVTKLLASTATTYGVVADWTYTDDELVEIGAMTPEEREACLDGKNNKFKPGYAGKKRELMVMAFNSDIERLVEFGR